jgi:putative cell wall-binding protein
LLVKYLVKYDFPPYNILDIVISIGRRNVPKNEQPFSMNIILLIGGRKMRKWFTLLTASILLSTSGLGATVYAENDTLTQEAKKKVSLLGYDSDGFFVEEEPNDAFEEANELMIEDAAKGSFTTDDKDMYKVTLDSDDPFYLFGGSFDENPTIELQVTVFDEEMNPVTPLHYEGDDLGLFAEYEVVPGTYYIAAEDSLNSGTEEEYYLATGHYSLDPYVNRLSGADRYETALQIAYEGWFEGTDEIILATGTNFPDALAGAPLAYYRNAPILLTGKDTIHETVKDAIYELGVEKVTILGGTGAISKKVEEELVNKHGVRTMRISGADRFETAVAISKKLPKSDTAIVVNGRNFPDALTIASYAAQYGYPILLSEKDSIPAVSLNQAKTYPSSYVIGGTGAVGNSVLSKLNMPTRIPGKDRYETSANVVRELDMNTSFSFLATGTKFADALSGSVLAAYWGEPLLLTPPDSLHPEVRELLSEQTFGVTILGGKAVISENVEDEVWSIINNQ